MQGIQECLVGFINKIAPSIKNGQMSYPTDPYDITFAKDIITFEDSKIRVIIRPNLREIVLLELLRRVREPDFTSDSKIRTILAITAKRGWHISVQLLLERGASQSDKDEKGNDVLNRVQQRRDKISADLERALRRGSSVFKLNPDLSFHEMFTLIRQEKRDRKFTPGDRSDIDQLRILEYLVRMVDEI